MAWNEPGEPENKDKQEKKRDPWRSDSSQEGPPDLDQLIKTLHRKLTGRIQKNGPQKPSDPSGSAPSPNLGKKGLSYIAGIAVIVIAVLWFLSGIYIVSPAERAVILTFGKYMKTEGPGPHWIAQGIQQKIVVDVQRIDTYSYESLMLTRDENIVSVAVAVQYRVADPKNYLFNVVSPIESIKQATASALRQVIGNSTLDQVLTTGRELIRDQVSQQLSQILDSYQAGVIITDVALQPAKAPDEVKDAFDDAIKAQEDEQRYINQAQAYAMGVEPIAKGQASRILSAASGYQKQIVLKARADVANYLALLPIYTKDPIVTRERMYMDAMQDVLSQSSKIVLDTGTNSLAYLPLEQLMSNQNMVSIAKPNLPTSTDLTASTAAVASAPPSTSTTSQNTDRPGRDDFSSLASRDAFMRGNAQ